MTRLTICIPCVGLNTGKEFIRNVFTQCNIGNIERIDLVTGKDNSKAFVHFKTLFDNAQSRNVRDKLMQGEYIYVVYEKPWFWRCSKKR